MKVIDQQPQSFTLDELAAAAGLPRRTVRYYIQIDLLERAEGETRAARYNVRHLEQLVAIRRWTELGISLERVRDLLSRAAEAPTGTHRAPGSVEVWSHIAIADGLEITLEASRAGLDPEQVRHFARLVVQAYEAVRKEDQ
jgi:DNA-binding transcriptional MerR regulator